MEWHGIPHRRAIRKTGPSLGPRPMTITKASVGTFRSQNTVQWAIFRKRSIGSLYRKNTRCLGSLKNHTQHLIKQLTERTQISSEHHFHITSLQESFYTSRTTASLFDEVSRSVSATLTRRKHFLPTARLSLDGKGRQSPAPVFFMALLALCPAGPLCETEVSIGLSPHMKKLLEASAKTTRRPFEIPLT